jgi:hypothetical protein
MFALFLISGVSVTVELAVPSKSDNEVEDDIPFCGLESLLFIVLKS